MLIKNKLADRAFNNLTLKQQQVWGPVMRDCLTEYSTAKLLGLTRDAVHDRLNKARRRYKKFITQQRKLNGR